MTKCQEWDVDSLGVVAELVMGQSPESRYYSEAECGLPFLQGCAEFQARYPKHVIYCSQEKKVARTGSILFSVRAPVGKLNIADRDYIIGRGLAAILGIRVDQTYLAHYLCYEESRFRIASQGSTFEAINSCELSSWPINYPIDRSEQTKIAEVLSTVDRAIEQTEALIAKQQRIKTGLMQDLLTRGLDEHGNLRSEETHEFKESPLGRIPMEWQVRQLGYFVSEVLDNRGRTPPLDYYGQNELLEIASLRNVEKNPDYNTVTKRVSDKIFTSGYFRQHLSAGDVLVSTVGSVGLTAYIDIPRGGIAQNIIGLRFTNEACSEFMFYWTRSAQFSSEIAKVVMDAVQPSLKRPHLLGFQITCPVLEEQKELARIINSAVEMIEQYKIQLHKLRRIRASLMQDLLTGKVRVTPLLTEPEAAST